MAPVPAIAISKHPVHGFTGPTCASITADNPLRIVIGGWEDIPLGERARYEVAWRAAVGSAAVADALTFGAYFGPDYSLERHGRHQPAWYTAVAKTTWAGANAITPSAQVGEGVDREHVADFSRSAIGTNRWLAARFKDRATGEMGPYDFLQICYDPDPEG